MVKLKKQDVFLAVSTALMLTFLVNIPLVNARPSDPTEGIAEDVDEVSGSGWTLYAKVIGEWHWLWQERKFVWYWFNHEGGRAAWWSIVFDGPLIICGEAGGASDYYFQSAGTPDGSVVAFTGISGEYIWGRTKAVTWFRDWLTGANWEQWTGWATLGSPPP